MQKDKREMVLVKAKYKTLLRDFCDGVGTDQTCEFIHTPVGVIRTAVTRQDKQGFRSCKQFVVLYK